MLWKLVIVAAAAAILIGGALWVADGTHIYTKDREKVVTISHDPIFGTEVEEVTWVENFQYGLFPDHAHVSHLHRSYAFILGLGGGAILVSLFMLRRARRTA